MISARAEKGRRSLLDFSQMAWKWIEPGQMQINWHVECLADHLVAVSNRQIKRLLINLPPRHMKSILASTMWPAWTWAQKTPLDREGVPMSIKPNSWLGPGVKFTFLSYAGELSSRDSVKCRQLIDSPWYQEHYGENFSFSPDQNTKTRYTNTMNGFRLALSFEGRITGEGADILCLPSWVEVLTEIGPIPIGRIVEEKMQLRVWSYNHDTEQAELRPLLDHEIHPPRELVEITTSDGKVLTCTIDHPIYVVGKGYIPAGDVSEDDEVIVAD